MHKKLQLSTIYHASCKFIVINYSSDTNIAVNGTFSQFHHNLNLYLTLANYNTVKIIKYIWLKKNIT